ncbi:UDP-2,4-diacetamido-2,4,6-trideoxy-beta-L-altropyranose hydrolase [Mariniblastus fucicola]|uniref:UDP-2,4-diacetamido-2,4, 6-trideoxy-beta-L-altropyranose hydrolase n=1 Tax=Mariniblastus fucicola TaxID=980251 RepID=A0A5B9PAY7_9BACT|nr:UDP-2,4-diacetamido-2,4,6-trideoxy-beta-L-altropyranose hydrolase [Mariniblastus fucicola]QEG23498.1 UDP-2,4-diacetamido-2,4,6-trideoxy-beta-L-altropyranose hydrolase [Mariniblastus fucicola]
MSRTLTPTRTELMNVVIRADAGPAIGTGHVMRMMALGEACCKLGAGVTMLCGQIPAGLVQRLIRCGIDVHQLKSPTCDQNDAAETMAFARQQSADWIVLDGYGFCSQYQHAMSKSEAVLMMMDDGEIADRNSVDVVLNQNAYAAAELGDKGMLAGCEFTLLRSEFLSASASEPKSIRQTARRILVTLGGCDDANWTMRVLKAMSFGGSQKLIVDVVVGAGYRHFQSLMDLKKVLPFTIRIHRNVDRMVDVMRRVDFAITAGGSTCYELARCGVPSLAIPVADNQIPIVEALEKYGTLTAFDPDGEDQECSSRLTRMIRDLSLDAVTRDRMSQAGRTLVDGKGAFRIARQMANWGLKLREAEMSDAEVLLAWRNDPEVRSVSFNSDRMSLETFRIWLQKKMENQQTRRWIAETRNGLPIGQVCLEFENPQQAVIELTLDHTRRGKGLGRTIIERACKLGFEENPLMDSVVARICPGNVASERAFRSVGFVQTQPTMINKKLAFQFVLWRDAANRQRRAVA